MSKESDRLWRVNNREHVRKYDRERRRSPRGMTHASWRLMIERCYKDRPQSAGYRDRGITVCESWRNSFDDFVRDMGMRPPGTTLDRIDPNGNYEPSNCRWATNAEQQRNKRITRLITYKGESLIVNDWAKRVGLRPGTLWHRILKGWSTEKALTTPSHHGNRKPKRDSND